MVAFSPNGKVIFSGSAEGILAWETATGRRLRTLREPMKNVYPVIAVCPVGTLLAATFGREVQLWDWSTGRELRQRRAGGAHSEIWSLAFSPDGILLAGGARGGLDGDKLVPGRAYLWDVASGKLLLSLAHPSDGRIRFVAFSPDGRLLACAGTSKRHTPREVPLEERANPLPGRDPTRPNNVIRLWEVGSGQEVFRIVREDAHTDSLAFSPDGRLLAATGNTKAEQDVWLWDARTGKRVHAFEAPEELYRPDSPVFTPDSKLLATVQDKTVLLWDVSPFNRPVPPGPALPPAALERLWDDLASADVAAARRAVWALVAVPKQSVPLLRDRLRPFPPTDAKQIAALIADLNDNHFAVRERASDELAKLGSLAAPALHDALKAPASQETRRRLTDLVALLRPPLRHLPTLRTLRALEMLEHVGGEEATKVLRVIAAGMPGTAETKEAEVALKRQTSRAAVKK